MMAEKLTRIRVPGRKSGDYGLMDWGEKSHAEMVSLLRHRANYLRDVVAAVDATPDADFEVDIVAGSVMQRPVRKVEPHNG